MATVKNKPAAKKATTKSKIVQMNMSEYAAKIGVVQSAMTYRVRNDVKLPGVTRWTHDGRKYTFFVNPEKLKKDLKAGS